MQARDAIRTAGRVLVVEGYMDVVALAQFGVGYAVATLGTATTPVHVTKLLKLADELVFSFDGDAAGRKAAWRALEVALPLAPDGKPVRFLFLPDGDDPDTFIRKHGKDAFESKVAQAQPLSEFLMGELRAQCDVRTAEGQAQFVAAAKPYLQKVAAPALKLQLTKEVARLGGPDAGRSPGRSWHRAEAAALSAAPRRPGASSGRRRRTNGNFFRELLPIPRLVAEIDSPCWT